VELKEEVVEEENGGVSTIMPELLTGDLFFKKQGVEIGREVKKARERDTHTNTQTHRREGMEQTRSWFNRFQPREKAKGSPGKMKDGSASSDSGKESLKGFREGGEAEELPSSITRQKVAAAKQYIENHYKSQMKSLQERKER
jgi:hypothetical protein